MPMMRLGEKGEYKINVNMIQLLVSETPQASLLKNSSTYDAVLKYNKNGNIYHFTLK